MATSEKPISLYPLTPEEALRRAMRASVPKDETKAKGKETEPKRPRKRRQAKGKRNRNNQGKSF